METQASNRCVKTTPRLGAILGSLVLFTMACGANGGSGNSTTSTSAAPPSSTPASSPLGSVPAPPGSATGSAAPSASVPASSDLNREVLTMVKEFVAARPLQLDSVSKKSGHRLKETAQTNEQMT